MERLFCPNAKCIGRGGGESFPAILPATDPGSNQETADLTGKTLLGKLPFWRKMHTKTCALKPVAKTVSNNCVWPVKD